MNKINLNFNKKISSTSILIVVILLFAYPVYYVNGKIRNYKTEVLNDYTKLAELESEKRVLDIYYKIMLKGSQESVAIKKHIISSDRKEVLGLINELENYTKKVGLTDGVTSPIMSVSTRENAELSKYKAADLVITMKVVGSQNNIDIFISLLDNLPLISYVEKIDIKFDGAINKNNATIVLVMYQKNEVK